MVRFGITSSPATRNLGLELVSRLARPVMGVWVRGIMLDMSDPAGFGLLRTRNRERVLEIRFSFRRIRLCRQQRVPAAFGAENTASKMVPLEVGMAARSGALG